MRTSRIFAPLALVGAVFVAVAAALYFYAVPHPVWTTSSPKVQGAVEFLGVYKGVPRHLAKYRPAGGFNEYDGDLSAFFKAKINTFNKAPVYSQIIGKTISTKPAYLTGIAITSNDASECLFRVGVPEQYVPDLQNGLLVLVEGGRTIGKWRLKGMPAPQKAIDPSEPLKLEAQALGYRFRLMPPVKQIIEKDSKTGIPLAMAWQYNLVFAAPKADPRDRYQFENWLNRTTWKSYRKTGWAGTDLTSATSPLFMSQCDGSYSPADRIDLGIRVRRYRVLKEAVVLKDAVFERCADTASAKKGIDLGYRLSSCSNRSFKTPGGLSMRVVGGKLNRYASGQLIISLHCESELGSKAIAASPLGRSTNKPIQLSSDGGFAIEGQDLMIYRNLPFKAGPKTVRLKEYKLVFYQQATLDEEETNLLAPVK